MFLPLDVLSAFVLASAVLCVMPGPDNLFVLSQSAIYGKKSGIFVTLGLCIGLIFHTFVVAMGLAVVIQSSPAALLAIKLFGAGYLLYLAWQAFRASSVAENTVTAGVVSNAAMLRRGIIMNVSNPKVSIFFLAFLPQFASAEYGAIAPQLVLLGGVFILVTLAVFSSFALLSGVLRTLLNSKPNAQLYINRGAGLVLTILAITLLSSNI